MRWRSRRTAAGTRPRRGTDTAKSGWRWAIDARVAKRASRLRAAIDEAGAVYLPERLHDVRLAIKKMRYALELGADASGARREPDLRALTRGQEILGRMLDLQMLIDRVRDVQAALTPPSLGVWRDLDAVVAVARRRLPPAACALHAGASRAARDRRPSCARPGRREARHVASRELIDGRTLPAVPHPTRRRRRTRRRLARRCQTAAERGRD